MRPFFWEYHPSVSSVLWYLTFKFYYKEESRQTERRKDDGTLRLRWAADEALLILMAVAGWYLAFNP